MKEATLDLGCTGGSPTAKRGSRMRGDLATAQGCSLAPSLRRNESRRTAAPSDSGAREPVPTPTA